MLLDHGTWIVAADGARAMIMRNDGSPAKPKFTLLRRYEQENPPTHEQGTDRPGRTNDAGTHRSAMEEVDWHQLAEDRFVHGLVGELAGAFNRHEFEALVIVAPPAALGEMRKALPDGDHLVQEAIEEHQQVKEILAAIERADSAAERDPHLVSLIGNVRHHVDEEETELFPKLRASITTAELQEMGATLAAAKKMAPTHPHPNAPNTPPGNLVGGVAAAVMDKARDALKRD